MNIHIMSIGLGIFWFLLGALSLVNTGYHLGIGNRQWIPELFFAVGSFVFFAAIGLEAFCVK